MEMVKWIKHFLCNHEDLPSNPKNPHKSQACMAVGICNPSVAMVKWELKREEFLGD